MKFLVVASILACVGAAAVPDGYLDSPYAVAPGARLPPAAPTISAGDIHGAAIDAHVEAVDHDRAAYDASRQRDDKIRELHGQAINHAEEQAWRAVDNVKKVESQLDSAAARLDGATAAVAPVLAKQLVGRVAPAAPAVAPYNAPAASPYFAPAAAPYAAASYIDPAIASYNDPAVASYADPAFTPYSAQFVDSAPAIAEPYPYFDSPFGYPTY